MYLLYSVTVRDLDHPPKETLRCGNLQYSCTKRTLMLIPFRVVLRLAPTQTVKGRPLNGASTQLQVNEYLAGFKSLI